MLVIFDFDNTLEEFAPHERVVEDTILSALAQRYALSQSTLRDAWEGIKRAYVHPRALPSDYDRAVWLRDLFRIYHLPEPVDTWKHIYWAQLDMRVRAYPDAIAAIQTLEENCTVCILSDSDGDLSTKRRRVAALGLLSPIDQLFTSDAVGHNKPHPRTFLQVLEHYGIAAENAVMVGDNPPTDLATAHELGMRTIWVTRGATPEQRRTTYAYVDATVETLAEVPDAVATLSSSSSKGFAPVPLTARKLHAAPINR